MRICLFGNSHLAALRDGWAAHPGRWPGLAPTFVGAHRNHLMETAIRDGRLVPVTQAAQEAFRRLGGVDSVDLAAYDGFVIAGCQIGLHSAAVAWRDMRWTGLESVAACPDLALMRPRLVSRPAARETLAARLSARLGLAFARHLRSATDRPVWLCSQPRVSAAILATPRRSTASHAEALRLGDAPGLSALFEDAAALAAARAGAVFVPQPPQTVQDHILTALPYVEGASRLAARPGLPQPPDDIMHANAAFGALMLDAVAARMRGAAPAAGGEPTR